MIDFGLGPRLEALREFLHGFAATELRPRARAADRAGTVEPEVITRLGELGGEQAHIVGDAGEHSEGLISVIAAEELAWGDAAMILNIPGPGLAGPSITAAGTPAQRQRFLHDVFDGPVFRFGALAVTEAQAGSDVSNVRTSATRDGGEWVLRGTKIFCTNGARADVLVVNATVDLAAGHAGQRLFVVLKGTPGMRVGRIERKLGLTASETAELVFEECRLPLDHLVGESLDGPSGFKGTMRAFDASRPAVAAMALGIGRAAYEYVAEWSRTEIPAHSRRRPQVAARLGTVERELAAARALCRRAAWMADRRIANSKEASMAKAFAPRAALRACVSAIEVMGPEGYSTEHLVEKWFRDIKVYDIFEGTGQIQRVIIGRHILGRLD
ncbi:MAG TPA: acyl-CoA dehydrogenase family protein [Actinomycetota bacterium]|nr:acyl-CoA dehydrogenase family protein [Actinomycetota bacterium]